MKLFLLAALATVAVAAPQGYALPTPSNTYAAPRNVDSDESVEFIPILRNNLIQEEDGTYSLDVETGNGIVLEQDGDSDGDKQGVISFTHPDGTEFHMTYIADENGFQPQSDALPVAPAFPHPIPEFVLEQIRFAASQKEVSSEELVAPRATYGAPRSKRDAPPRSYAAPPAPSNTYAAPRSFDSDESAEHIPILRNDVVQGEDGTYSIDVETGNGIVLSQSGDSDGDKQGVISFTHPDGSEFHLTYVADENGFQPQSDALPVAPAFPHPIPEFVLEQIRFAASQREEESSEEVNAPSATYGAPRSKRAAQQGYGYEAPAPTNTYAAPRKVDSDESVEQIPILRQDLVQKEDGAYSLDVETGNGIVLAQSGDSDGDKQGEIRFTLPDGTEFHMTYVANENGFQPQSDFLPVAPAFPHPIPDFVLEQIEFARQQDEAAAREAKSSVRVPSSRYGAPDSSEEK